MDPEVVRRLEFLARSVDLSELGRADLRAFIVDWERRGEALARYRALVWQKNTGTVDSCRFCGVWRDDPKHRESCPAALEGKP